MTSFCQEARFLERPFRSHSAVTFESFLMSKQKSGLVRFDVEKFEQARLRAGFSSKQLFRHARIAEKTGYGAARGEECRVATAMQLVKALGVEQLNELLANGEQTDTPVETKATAGLPAAWEIVDSISPWITAANGLQYRVYRLQHRHLPDELARGKCFDLDNMAYEQAGELRDVLLVRHAQVCRVLASSSFFPTNQSVDISKKLCWVIDSWPRGESLTTHMTAGVIPESTIPAIMISLATALRELHVHEMVLRDLHPDIIYYEIDSGQLTIVDLELAKLLDGSPTVVHGQLKENSFRAPECVGHKFDHTADVFSWGQILRFLVSGHTPTSGKSPTEDIALPPQLFALWQSCLADSYRERPQSFADLILAVKRWKP